MLVELSMPTLALMFRLGSALLLAAPASASTGAPSSLLARGNRAYFSGDYDAALSFYRRAARVSPATALPWINGAVILDELGRRKEAVSWHRRAAALSNDPDLWSALGWAQWRARQWTAASASFEKALFRDPRNAYALLGLARVCLSRGRPSEAIPYLHRAEDGQPLLDLAPYYEGRADEALGRERDAVDAYKRAVVSDSYFLEARDALGRADLKRRDFNDAWRQFVKILDGEPHNRRYISLVNRLTPRLTRRAVSALVSHLHARPAPVVPLPVDAPGVPLVRVGLGTDFLGRPKKRQSLSFKSSCVFSIADAGSRRTRIEGDAGEVWRIVMKRIRRRRMLVVYKPSGRAAFSSRTALLIRPQDRRRGVLTLDPVSGGRGAEISGKAVRGVVEASVFKSTLRVVNIVDLETYTEGVVAAEMPIHSPLEALKAQAIVARSHALFIMKVSRRHRRQGYDVCDGQHCQVYDGLRAETDRSREVVEGTRGEVVLYHGKIAHVIYSSNCGGYTQNGDDLTGWGYVPYWKRVADAAGDPPPPDSPWALRRWLTSWPRAFCQPSNDVFPSHYRWSRVIPWSVIAAKADQKLHVGRLRYIRVLRRSASGNVNGLLVAGSRRKAKVKDEMKIRDLLALGPLRSTLFVMDTEYGPDGRPQAVVFHGGGWGHGVGLCQSGAMGRAEAGENAERIIKSYFKGVTLGRLQY